MMPLLSKPRQMEIATRTTPCDLVRMLKPEATDDECDFLLWEKTSFPFGTVNEWFAQLRKVVVQ